jgi:hypothetical protein
MIPMAFDWDTLVMQDDRPKMEFLPNVALFGVLVTVQFWFFTIYSFLGNQNPDKRALCSSRSIAATVFLLTVGRKAMAGRWQPGQPIGLTGFQACWVTILVIAGGLFHWWMLN